MNGAEERLGALLREAAPVAEPIDLEDVEATVGRRARARASAVALVTVAAVAVGGLAIAASGSWRDLSTAAHGGRIPWVDAAPTTYVAPPRPGRTTEARPCAVGDLHVASVAHDEDPAGRLVTRITLTNVSDDACLLSGTPDVVALLDGSPDVRATPAASAQGPGPADMARGESSVLTFSSTTRCPGYAPDLRPLLRVAVPGGTLDVDDPEGTDVGCGLAVAPFDGPVPAEPGVPDPMAELEASIAARPTLAPGRELVYTVTLTNPTRHEIALDRCPSYVETLEGVTTVTASYALACPDAIGPGASVRFEMRFPVPEETSMWLAASSQSEPTWPVRLGWALDAPFDVSASAQMTLVPAPDAAGAPAGGATAAEAPGRP